ncbi:protein of unknown function (plasmid) [Cupriavidus taiwanensis]|uniref:Uncharacterized protein n=1 Tax=Cupriavidus taiwanensis TaxID=164546 RepID=A0A375EC48_9BURK|nr:protein of unknown function [Cupriavidus taiwanensis]SOZ72335.1 protein of unknown function [Cupriavidus taiwanensis]SOZ74631.1 protein of unknown function [Cupriavidus taiwanensis]SPA03542.1 protein of unknown function [Cupriavidus taiwanensis]SPA11440.1 protein of unknown function [Cupriavidus taiwanensis]
MNPDFLKINLAAADVSASVVSQETPLMIARSESHCLWDGATMRRPGIKVGVSAGEREQTASMSRSRSLPHSLVRRAKIVLMALCSNF